MILVFVGAPGAGKSTLFYDASRNTPIFQELYGTTYMGTGLPPSLLPRHLTPSYRKRLTNAGTHTLCCPIVTHGRATA